MKRYALWSELLPLEAVREPATLALLRRYDAELRLACFEGQTDADELAKTLSAARDADVQVALWPMLEDREGRWASAHNGETFARYARRLVAELRARGCAPRAMMVDLEPPIDVMKRWLDRAHARVSSATRAGGPTVVDSAQRVEGDRAIEALCAELGEGGVRVGAAVVPGDLLGRWGGRAIEWLLGLPVSEVAYAPASVMLYSSMLEGYSRGWISRARARSIVTRGCRRAIERFGPRAEASLGVVGTGALGDEPIYRDPRELEEDVQAARSAGMQRLALFDLRGVLARGAPERWLDALTR